MSGIIMLENKKSKPISIDYKQLNTSKSYKEENSSTEKSTIILKNSQASKNDSQVKMKTLKSIKSIKNYPNIYNNNKIGNNYLNIPKLEVISEGNCNSSRNQIQVTDRSKSSRKENNPLTNRLNEITVNERRKIRSFSRVYTKEIDFNIINSDQSTKRNEKDSDNLKRLKKLMQTSPYLHIPAKVKYSTTEMLEKYADPNLRNHILTKQGHQYKHVISGGSSIFFKKNQYKENLLKKLLTLKEENIPSNFRKSIKWKNLKFLLNSKRNFVDLIIDCYKDIEWFVQSRNGKLNQLLFEELISIIQSKKDKEMVEHFFLIFDDDRDGFIDFKEMMAGLAMFKDDYYHIKMNILTLISCKDDLVDVDEFLRFIRIYIFNKKDWKRLYDLIKINNFNGLVDKEDFFEFLVNNEEVKHIFARSMENVLESEANFDEELNNFCRANLKKSKMVMNMDIEIIRMNEYEYFDSILKVRHDCIEAKKANYKLELMEHDSFSEDEK